MRHYPILTKTLSNGESLAYRQAGLKGPRLVLLHGNLSSSVHFLTLMNRLEQDFQLLAIDMRGFGQSSYHQPITSLKDLAEDIWLLLDELQFTSPHLLGWSTGGGVGLEMAAQRPKELKTLILLSSIGIAGYKMEQNSTMPLLPFIINTNRHMAKWNPALQRMEYALKHQDKAFLDKILKPLYRYRQISSDEYQLYLEGTCQQRNYSDLFPALLTFNMTDRHNGWAEGDMGYQAIETPVLIIHGNRDKVVRPEQALLTHHYLQHQATIHLLEAGHSILTDQPEKLDQLLKEYLN